MRPSIRFDVFKRDGFRCVYCGRRSPEVILEVDHVLALANGGTDELDNLVTSCTDCNRGKSDRPLTEVPAALDPKARAERIAEHERQIAEYARWRAAQREREDEQIALLSKVFSAIPGATFHLRGDNGEDEERWYWQEPTVRTFVRRLGAVDVLEAIEVVAEKASWLRNWSEKKTAESVWRYFCGVCWKRIKEPDEESRAGNLGDLTRDPYR